MTVSIQLLSVFSANKIASRYLTLSTLFSLEVLMIFSALWCQELVDGRRPCL